MPVKASAPPGEGADAGDRELGREVVGVLDEALVDMSVELLAVVEVAGDVVVVVTPVGAVDTDAKLIGTITLSPLRSP